MILLTALLLNLNPDMEKIGLKVWQNECRGTVEGLVSWNEGEAFPSLGIGHFIWYPENAHEPFEETFPAFIALLKEQEVKLPYWLSHAKHFPYKTRQAFLKEKRSKKINELREILTDTIGLQTQFLTKRFEENAESIIAASKDPETTREKIALLRQTPAGTFALIDYVNFKGTGLKDSEKYRGQGWGLLQVLESLPAVTAESAPMAFSIASYKVLQRRVQNAPQERHEERWLKGWQARCEKYR